MDNIKLTIDDINLFLDLIRSRYGPNYEPGFFKVKPYIKTLKNKNSEESQRFIKVYNSVRHFLTDKESKILDELYGINKESSSLKDVALMFNISPERVRQIRNKAEFKLGGILVKSKD